MKSDKLEKMLSIKSCFCLHARVCELNAFVQPFSVRDLSVLYWFLHCFCTVGHLLELFRIVLECVFGVPKDRVIKLKCNGHSGRRIILISTVETGSVQTYKIYDLCVCV